jgi:23S rRNA (cytosine1962-C5)-methyltransferase
MKPIAPKTIKIKVSKKNQKIIRSGYPWVFYYQIQNRDTSGALGDIGVVYDADKQFLAAGLYDPYSDIRLRILRSKAPVEFDKEFFRRQFAKALARREGLEAEGTTGYRVLNGENDGFPGMVLDKYSDTAVLKLYTASWLVHLDKILPLIKDDARMERCVLLLSRHVQRTLPKELNFANGQILYGTELSGPVRFQENKFWFEADVLQGQKTGFYLDQRENRKRIGEMAQGKSVLNVFSYTGGFTVYAFNGKCAGVVEIDSNRFALEAAKNNLKLNFPGDEFSSLNYQQMYGDAFKLLAELEKEHKKFDIVILDPPAFAKNKAHKKNALLAYTRLVKAGARRTQEGGILFAASCSAPVEAREFYHAVDLGIKSSGRSCEELLRTEHAIDHPVTFKEGAYLKAVYCRIM